MIIIIRNERTKVISWRGNLRDLALWGRQRLHLSSSNQSSSVSLCFTSSPLSFSHSTPLSRNPNASSDPLLSIPSRPHSSPTLPHMESTSTQSQLIVPLALPVFFTDYWTVLKEIQDLCKNSSLVSPVLRYMQLKADSFGGNFSTQKRISYFDHENTSLEVPCGFLKKFPISNYDRVAMENCNGIVVVSAIFNDHDKIRQPKGLGSKTLNNVCFFMFVDDITLNGLDYHKLISKESREYKIGAWRIVRVSSKQLYENPAMNGVIPKYLVHRLFPNSKFSIWIDAKLQLMVDPLLLIHTLIVSENADMAVSKHPYYVQTMEEAMATARWKKWWDVDALKTQMETYCDNGLRPWSPKKLPYTSDVPDSALILRKHELGSNLFSCLLFNELEAFNPRDQLAFAYVRDHMKPKLKLNMFEVEVFEQVAVEYRHNLKHSGGTSGSEEGSKRSKTKKTKRAGPDLLYVNGSCCSKCQKYLLEMWGESHS